MDIIDVQVGLNTPIRALMEAIVESLAERDQDVEVDIHVTMKLVTTPAQAAAYLDQLRASEAP